MTEFSAFGGSTTDHKAVAQAVSYLAALKNIKLTPDQQARVTDGVLAMQQGDAGAEAAIRSMPVASVFVRPEETRPRLPSAIPAVNTYLDAVAACRVKNLVATIEGKEWSDPAVTQTAKEIVDVFKANAPDTQCLRWPDPMEWLKQFAGRPVGPLTELQPNGSVLTIYCLHGNLHRDAKDALYSGTDWGSEAGKRYMRAYAQDRGMGWAVDHPDLLRLGPGAIDTLKAVHFHRQTFERMQHEGGFAAKDIVDLADYAKRHNLDANKLGNVSTDTVRTLGDSNPQEEKKWRELISEVGRHKDDPAKEEGARHKLADELRHHRATASRAWHANRPAA
jgi:hypothetical protein